MKRKKSENKLKPLVTLTAKERLSNIGYTGNILVKILRGNDTYASKSFHNAGRWPLFQFFALCLNQEYAAADAFRPKFINLFNSDLLNEPALSDIHDTDLKQWFTSDRKVSTNTYPYLSDPNIIVANSDIGSANITYKFNVPFTQLATDSSGNLKEIKLVGLYSVNNKDEYANPSAFFFITNKRGEIVNLLSELVEAGVPAASYRNEYSLYIEWQLNISNPTSQN